MGIKNARKYTDDFKRRAVDLAKEIGNGEAASILSSPAIVVEPSELISLFFILKGSDSLSQSGLALMSSILDITTSDRNSFPAIVFTVDEHDCESTASNIK